MACGRRQVAGGKISYRYPQKSVFCKGVTNADFHHFLLDPGGPFLRSGGSFWRPEGSFWRSGRGLGGTLGSSWAPGGLRDGFWSILGSILGSTCFVTFWGSLSGGTLWRHFGSTLGLQAAKKGAQEAGPCAIRTRIIVFREGSTFSAKIGSGGCWGALGGCRGTILGSFGGPCGRLFGIIFAINF